jgi:hypothetical protein
MEDRYFSLRTTLPQLASDDIRDIAQEAGAPGRAGRRRHSRIARQIGTIACTVDHSLLIGGQAEIPSDVSTSYWRKMWTATFPNLLIYRH